jgi:hypothetical protein
VLDVSQCHDIGGIGFASLSTQSLLYELNLYDCRLTDTHLAHLAPLHLLQHLNLSRNPAITGAGLQALAGKADLQHLSLVRCDGLYGESVGQVLASLISLNHLDLTDCARLDDTSVLPLEVLVDLVYIGLVGTGITNHSLEVLARMDSLHTMDLDNCVHLNDQGLIHLLRLTRLTYLSIAGCPNLTLACVHRLKQRLSTLVVHR